MTLVHSIRYVLTGFSVLYRCFGRWATKNENSFPALSRYTNSRVPVLLSWLYGPPSPKAWDQLRSEGHARCGPTFLPCASWGQFHPLLLLPRGYAVHIFVLLSLDTFVCLRELSLAVLQSSILIFEQLPV